MNEVTKLTPDEEAKFQQWVQENHITDLDPALSHYDYRGFWKINPGFKRAMGQHLTDQFKMHGHPTFSQESQYSRGPSDGGMWVGPKQDRYLAQPAMGVSHTPSGMFEKVLLEQMMRQR